MKGQIFPKETGKPLSPHFITPEAAARSIEAAEEAQRSGKRPVIYTGESDQPPVVVPRRGTSISVQKEDVAGNPPHSPLFYDRCFFSEM